MENPADYQYDIDTVEVGAGFRGSVVVLLLAVGYLTLPWISHVLRHDPKLDKFDGRSIRLW